MWWNQFIIVILINLLLKKIIVISEFVLILLLLLVVVVLLHICDYINIKLQIVWIIITSIQIAKSSFSTVGPSGSKNGLARRWKST